MADALKTIQAVKCGKCGKLHDATSEVFVVFHGPVTKGMEGGIAGGQEPAIYCASPGCLGDLWKELTGVGYTSTR